MNSSSTESAGGSRLDGLIAEYLALMDDGKAVDVEQFLRPYPELAEEFHQFLQDQELANRLQDSTISVQQTDLKPEEAFQDTTSSMGLHPTIATMPRRTEYGASPSKPEPYSHLSEPLPRSFGRYLLLEELGRGAMGSVFLAEDTELRRRVALKVPRFNNTLDKRAMIERFFREARASATLSHPNICPVYDIGEREETFYITMGLIQGKCLGEIIQANCGLNQYAALTIARKIALALAEAHHQGIVHRDLKPGNIMIDHRSEPIVMDFGLAREMNVAGEEQLTQDGAIVGTPAYMSPEQIDGVQSNVGPQSDIYSLGIVFYEMLTGQLPYSGGPMSVLAQIASKTPVPPREIRAGISAETEKVCLKMIAKQPTERFNRMGDVAIAMANCLRILSQDPEESAKTTSAGSTATVLKTQADQIRTLISASQWVKAEQLLITLANNPAPKAAKYVKWAITKLKFVREAMEQNRVLALKSLQSAQSSLQKHNYVEAITTLLRVDASSRTAKMTELLEEATAAQTQVELLFKQIERSLKTNQLQGTLANLHNLLRLKPNDPVAEYLFRRFKWQARFGILAGFLADAFAPARSEQIRSNYEEPFLRKWLGIIGLVFLLFCGLTATAVTLYLQQDNKKSIALRGAVQNPKQINAHKHLEHDNFAAPDPENLPSDQEGDSTLSSINELNKIADTQIHPGANPDVLEPSMDSSDSLSLPLQEVPQRKPFNTQHPVEFQTNHLGMKMKLIPAGVFLMGPDSVDEVNKGTRGRSVTLTKPFYLGVVEVSRRQWHTVMETTPWKTPESTHLMKEGDEVSATFISWDDAISFCRKLSEIEGMEFRLPTDAEWEYACRAGTTTRYSFGDEESLLGDYAWFSSGNPEQAYPHQGAHKKANPFGLFDMHGNVYEWCADWNGPIPNTAAVDPKGPLSGTMRVSRGGSFSARSIYCYSTRRRGVGSADRASSQGLRVAMDLKARNGHKNFVESSQGTFAKSINISKFFPDSPGITLNYIPVGSIEYENPFKKPELLTVQEPFYMATMEVTQQEWTTLMKSTPWKGKRSVYEGDRYPASYVTWDDAVAFCNRLSELEGRPFSLPTEAQWEYACRAGSTTKYYCGETTDNLPEFAIFSEYVASPTKEFGHMVGQRTPNAFGLYDMHGNVSEWCADVFSREKLTDWPASLTVPSSKETMFVYKGGSFHSSDKITGSSFRDGYIRSYHYGNMGFRIQTPVLPSDQLSIDP